MTQPTRTEDLVEIQQLLAKYAVTITQGDIDGLISVFTPDGTYSAFGSTYTLARFPELVDAAPKGLFMTGTSLVHLDDDDPDKATGTQPLCFIEQSKHDMRIGYYNDTYVRTAEGWRKTRAMTFIRRSGTTTRVTPCDRQTRGRMTATDDIPTTAEFRRDLIAWLDENDLTPPPGEHSLDAHHAQHSRVLSALYEAGWMRYGWPVEAGGLGGPPILRAIVGEEIVGRGLDEPGPYSMLEVLTPTMIDYAHPDLAAKMVPRLLSGRESWCQGFSEPGSGSDLASLTTHAEQRGDEWVVNGQKVWTSFAQYATRCVLLTRTGAAGTPNHEAITAFFVDLDKPGITVRPLRTMHGVDEFCEVYFDDVVVPADRMLGKPGDGWRLAMDFP
jgi:hypothetical protein